ncbi:TIGR02680 family protein [Pseudomonas fluorescens]|jgi:uncharacterized protein (TIGR02680 family)|uniref:TIGR02680 family protein n=1 Tax=Pseudomonas fluorescens TaxID=294 RepID=UPI003D0274D2
MSDLLFPEPRSSPSRPALPLPNRERWQPLRLGLLELFHYDSEEFWFRDGHLLLRGNNGTGKSKVLSLTLPLLLDANLRPSRVEPDGDSGKKMAWNVLVNSYDRRIGYAWIEFGRIAEDGSPHFLTLGVGLSAVAARSQVDSWYFLLEGDHEQTKTPRMGQDIWLITQQRVILTKERLRETLEGRGQIFENAGNYRRAVDERLFHLGTKRYEALMDTLVQLRQPQLSKKPDESSLSSALTEALRPLSAELLGDVAEALNQLEEDRRQLEEYQALAKAINRFDQRYRHYAAVQSRRQMRSLRQAQTEFDNASRARNETQSDLQAKQEVKDQAQIMHYEADLELTRQRAKFDTLRSNPTMQDANRLGQAAKDAEARQADVSSAQKMRDETANRLAQADETARQSGLQAKQAEASLADARCKTAQHAEDAGISNLCGDNSLLMLDAIAIAELEFYAFETAHKSFRAAHAKRLDHIALLQRRLSEITYARMLFDQYQQAQSEKQGELEAATERRELADAEVEREGQSHIDDWERHFTHLRHLQLSTDAPLASLLEWVRAPLGENPARIALHVAQQRASMRLAAHRIELENWRRELEGRLFALETERGRLIAGEETSPPMPHTRASDSRGERSGSPLWQLLDFREHVDAAQCAGLEAALEACGLLDAWVSPNGCLQTLDGTTLQDTQAVPRTQGDDSLANWLRAAVPDDSPIPAAIVEQILNSIVCVAHDPTGSENWVAPDGRFRLGALAGFWSKPTAVYIGFTARTAARERRLTEIAQQLQKLVGEFDSLRIAFTEDDQAHQQAEQEWHEAPSDDALRCAHLAADASAREFVATQQRLTVAATHYHKAKETLQVADQQLILDAIDLRLPKEADALLMIERALAHFNDEQQQLVQTAHTLRLIIPEWQRQQSRQVELYSDLQQLEEKLTRSRAEAEEVQAHLSVLRDTVGTKVEELQQQLDHARQAEQHADQSLKAAAETLREAGEARAVAVEKVKTAEQVLVQCSELREQAIAKLQQFAASGLLHAALLNTELPDLHTPWTIDPALTLARRTEQMLNEVKDDDDTWQRVQRQISEDVTELQRSLTALGQQAVAETSDWGLVVQIIYQNRPESPNQLAAHLIEEITQRSELLTANERTILENHLQAEIATEVQRLLQTAEKQVEAINKELHKHPTTTGVRYRLQWLPLVEGAGAPVGLETARKRLLNTSADLWSNEDRRVVGTMLQHRISEERERAEMEGGSLQEQLARALDYRRWHEFRVQRWQDGQWRKLSGPASSGERALGLTVPLFAAVASFYSQSSYSHAPRLILLDEAFAGIDDSARAHCMALVREFDLDFVITSEREWACYAELPGVSICQLQRREGIDAVFVSRWTWDGRSKRREQDPDRRFEPT